MPGVHKQSSKIRRDASGFSVRTAGEQFTRLESELHGQTRVLKSLACGDSLSDVLTLLIEVAEEARPEMIGSILLLDKKTGCLRHGAASSLPCSYREAIDGVKPGPNVGSCGTAAFTGQRVIAEDIRTHPFWTDYRDLADEASLRACWSEPILSSSKGLLGTFAMYYREPRTPDESDIEFVSNCANLAAIAIERVQADTTMRQMGAIVESTDAAVILKDLEGTIESWNQGAERIYGYSAAEAIGKPIAMIVPKDRSDELKTILRKLSQGGQIDHLESVRLTKERQLINVSLTISPVRDSTGKLTHFVSIGNEITKRVQIQKEFEREKAILETIVNGTPDAIMLADLDRRITYCNQGCDSIFGYEPGALVGQPARELYANPQDHERQGEERFHKDAREHFNVVEINWKRKNGEEFPGETVGTVIRDESGKPLGFLALIRDITERKRAEEILQESQRQLSTLMNNLPGAAYRCQRDEYWTVEFISDGCLDLCGYSAEEIVTRKPRWAEFIHVDDLETVRQTVRASLAEKEPFQLEYRIRHRNGEDRWVWEQGQGIFADDGELSAIEGFISDVTELHRARVQLVQGERLAAMGQMLSAIAHESRNALQRIQAGVDMLAFEFDEESEAKEDLDRIAHAREDLQHVFEELRNYAAPIKLQPSKCSLANVWRQAWLDLEPTRQQRDAQLHEELSRVDLVCSVDAFRVGQVFRNLMENSLAACSDPVRIEIVCEEADLDGAPAIRVIVRDNGPGLTEEQKMRMFEAFFTTKPKGTGLGMAIAQRIVEAHGGTIATGESMDAGAQFLVTLPRTMK